MSGGEAARINNIPRCHTVRSLTSAIPLEVGTWMEHSAAWAESGWSMATHVLRLEMTRVVDCGCEARPNFCQVSRTQEDLMLASAVSLRRLISLGGNCFSGKKSETCGPFLNRRYSNDSQYKTSSLAWSKVLTHAFFLIFTLSPPWAQWLFRATTATAFDSAALSAVLSNWSLHNEFVTVFIECLLNIQAILQEP